MNEAHQRFEDWLTAGADGEPPRDLAVHASVCAACRQSVAALDLLAIVNTGLASMPSEPTGREHSRLVLAGRLIGATAVLFSATILGVGVSQLIGVSQTNGPVAQASPTPDQDVLGETATPRLSPEATPASLPTPQETLTPPGTPVPDPRPVVTPTPLRTLAPTPPPTASPPESSPPESSPPESSPPTASPPESSPPESSPPESSPPTASPPESSPSSSPA
jgi:hypothetical protein